MTLRWYKQSSELNILDLFFHHDWYIARSQKGRRGGFCSAVKDNLLNAGSCLADVAMHPSHPTIITDIIVIIIFILATPNTNLNHHHRHIFWFHFQ